MCAPSLVYSLETAVLLQYEMQNSASASYTADMFMNMLRFGFHGMSSVVYCASLWDAFFSDTIDPTLQSLQTGFDYAQYAMIAMMLGQAIVSALVSEDVILTGLYSGQIMGNLVKVLTELIGI
jgi:hypothetical protein